MSRQRNDQAHVFRDRNESLRGALAAYRIRPSGKRFEFTVLAAFKSKSG